jgi:hypothetical protein
MLRDQAPDDTTLLVRAVRGNPDRAVASIVADAHLSAEVYEIETADGVREALYGISVFAPTDELTLVEILERFPSADTYFETTAGALRGSGLPVYATGSNPVHYDVQLLPGVADGPGEQVDTLLYDAARRIVQICGE